MNKNSTENALLKYFNVENYQQLMEYIKDNPADKKVVEIKELLKLNGVDFDSEVNANE